jgi:polysaccharide chain length determinant protein (PEP-CTERM system associated)
MHELLNIFRIEIRAAWRYRWYAMLAAWIICAAGWTAVYSLPNIYESQAQVYVDAQSRLAEVMGQVGVSPGVGARVFVVRQAMLSLPQLERVARETGLDLRATNEEERESLYAGLQQNIQVNTGRTSESKNLYTITFKDPDRDMALSVVRTLLNAFVEDVLKLKERGTEQVDTYLSDQHAYYEDRLEDAERELADFKKRNVGLLPGESGGVFERLQLEMAQLKQVEVDLGIERDRRDELRRQLQSDTPYLPENSDEKSTAVRLPGSRTSDRINELETQRANLLLSFTDRHPDVVALNEQLEQLYVQQEAERAARIRSGGGMEGAENATNPVYQTAQIALNDSSVKIVGLQSKLTQHRAAVEQLREQIDTIPEVEAQLAALTRDYDQYRALYSEILLRKERERMGKVDNDSDVVSFDVTAPPTVGLEPVGPKRTLMIFGVLIFGLGAGGGLAFVLSQAHPVFLDTEGLRRFMARPVLGQVSMTLRGARRRSRLLDSVSFVAATTGLIAFFTGVLLLQEPGVRLIRAALWQAGT